MDEEFGFVPCSPLPLTKHGVKDQIAQENEEIEKLMEHWICTGELDEQGMKLAVKESPAFTANGQQKDSWT